MNLVYRPNHPRANQNGMVDKRAAGPLIHADPATYVISDTIDPIKHMGTGQIIDSKARFRQHTRQAGCVEVGTDPAIRKAGQRPEPTVGEIAMDVKRAIAELNR